VVSFLTINPKSVKVIGGRYVLLPECRTGGMAQVFAARDIRTDTKVAVKILSAGHLGSEILKESFEREIRSLGQLHHPAIVNLLDHGFDDETRFNFIVLDWIESDLSTLLRARQIDSWDHFYSNIFRPLLEALSEAHSRGISHRDVKPSNILIDVSGSPFLTDFGISKLRSYLLPALTLNQFMSVPYSPPEVDDGSYTSTRDVYGIAAVAVRCLTTATITTHADLDSALDSVQVPIIVHAILKQALSIDPTRRHKNAAVLIAALDVAQEQRGITQSPKLDIYVDLSSAALEQLLNLLPDKSRDQATAMVLSDLNLVCGVGLSSKASALTADPILYGGRIYLPLFLCTSVPRLPAHSQGCSCISWSDGAGEGANLENQFEIPTWETLSEIRVNSGLANPER
jgi:serine/threonine protein kinase